MEQKPHIWGALECQEFIERIKRREFIEAAQYARQILAPNMLGNLPSSISSMDTSTGSSPRGNKRPMGIHDCHKRRIGPRTTGLSPQFGSQKYLNHHFHQQHKPSQQETMAGEVVGLLAYKNVGSSPLSYLLSKKRLVGSFTSCFVHSHVSIVLCPLPDLTIHHHTLSHHLAPIN